MTLFRTPKLDWHSPIVILQGRDAGCATPYFQRTLLGISDFADTGAGVTPDVTNKVDKNTSTGWTACTGTALKGGLATYTAPTISNPPTQAEVQAVANAVQTVSRAVKAIIDAGLTSELLDT